MSFPITILRAGAEVVTIKPDSGSNQQKTIMGDNMVTLQFSLNRAVAFKLGDFCSVYGENYFLNDVPTEKKVSTYRYEYTLTMRSEYFDLSKVQFMDYDTAENVRSGVFSLMGNADTFMDLLIKNANRVGAGWTRGTVIGTSYQNMTFNSESCLTVLGRLAQQFGTEYSIEGKKISLDKRQVDTGVTLRQGKDKGLYDITRKNFSDSRVITRLYAFGASTNLPPDYRNYAGRLLMTGGIQYLEKNTSKYGVIEAAKVWDDIYPHRTGKVTAVNAGNVFTFKDAAIDFNVNDQLLPGVSAKVTFNTGELAGYTFDIQKFDNIAKEFTILKNKDEKAVDVPSAIQRPAIGDEYVLVDIKMPQTYIDAAEAALKTAAQDVLNAQSEPLIEFDMTCDPAYFRKYNLTPNIGDLIWVVDANLEINKRTRVTSFTREFEDEYTFKLTLSDGVAVQPVQELYNNTGDNSREISNINQRLNNRTSENNFVGPVVMADIPTITDTTGYNQLFVDANGKVYKKV
ncbi:hypothetical protein [Chitinophaga varians]|uniref:hypothetical protein n=1 Tax=Chitinophaga varians TaxID=2202339 RepID=UPI00165EC156|nr:hypothetical protein [Chitinophaga varians]MBC9913191.1 hypothetical protein [Chitinophaga varians]